MNYGSLRRVAIVGANRIPFARSNTAYARLSNQDMLTATLQGLVKKCRLDGETLGEVAGGAVMKHSRDWNLVRECVLSSGLSPATPAYDVQQACGTGLEAAILVANKIALGQIEAGIACDAVDVAGDGQHFEAVIVSDAFRGLSRLARHRLVYAALGDRMRAEIHALSMTTVTPDERAAR